MLAGVAFALTLIAVYKAGVSEGTADFLVGLVGDPETSLPPSVLDIDGGLPDLAVEATSPDRGGTPPTAAAAPGADGSGVTAPDVGPDATADGG